MSRGTLQEQALLNPAVRKGAEADEGPPHEGEQNPGDHKSRERKKPKRRAGPSPGGRGGNGLFQEFPQTSVADHAAFVFHHTFTAKSLGAFSAECDRLAVRVVPAAGCGEIMGPGEGHRFRGWGLCVGPRLRPLCGLWRRWGRPRSRRTAPRCGCGSHNILPPKAPRQDARG